MPEYQRLSKMSIIFSEHHPKSSALTSILKYHCPVGFKPGLSHLCDPRCWGGGSDLLSTDLMALRGAGFNAGLFDLSNRTIKHPTLDLT